MPIVASEALQGRHHCSHVLPVCLSLVLPDKTQSHRHTGEAHEFRNIPGNEARAGHNFSARTHEERSVD
jgi:hypothetical protein